MENKSAPDHVIDGILNAAKHGGYLDIAASFLTPDLKQTPDHPAEGFFVVENYYGYGIYIIENYRIVGELCRE